MVGKLAKRLAQIRRQVPMLAGHRSHADGPRSLLVPVADDMQKLPSCPHCGLAILD